MRKNKTLLEKTKLIFSQNNTIGYLILLILFASCSPTYDVIIRNGNIYDGSGLLAYKADLGIKDNKIAFIGKLKSEKAKVEVDATGMAVSPGFINMLSWANNSLLEDGRSMSDIKQGVTLEVFGEGASMGPLNDKMKLARGGTEWTTLGEYLEHLVQKGVSTNVASFVGATTVRINVLGYDNRRPNAEELTKMQDLVREAMEEGAMGLGSSLIYPPAFFASTEELIALAKAASEYNGMYISHLRSEGNAFLQAVDELLTIADEAEIDAEIYHLKAAGKNNWHKLEQVIAKIDSANKAGLKITTNMYTYTAASTGLDATLPPWVQEGGKEAWLERMRLPEIRERLIAEVNEASDSWENFYLMAGGSENIMLAQFDEDSLSYLAGKSLKEISEIRQSTPVETIIDLILDNGGDISTIYFLMSEDNIEKKIKLPYMTFGSDGGSFAAEGKTLESSTHPRAYGNFSRVLGKYVRENKSLTLEEAIRKMTSLAAQKLKISDRGRLAPGFFADIVIFDPETIADQATFDNPHQYANGVLHVFVNGVQVLKDGQHTGQMPGMVVRGPGYKKR